MCGRTQVKVEYSRVGNDGVGYSVEVFDSLLNCFSHSTIGTHHRL